MKNLFCISFLIIAFSLSIQAQNKPAARSVSTGSTQTKHKQHMSFDPKRNAEEDIAQAIERAKSSHKRILLDVGGLWCSWCRKLDKFFDDNTDAERLLENNFILVKVNYSPDNKNEKVLARYPKVAGYPHLFILDKDGKLLHSQDTAQLESGTGYDKERIMLFLNEWRP